MHKWKWASSSSLRCFWLHLKWEWSFCIIHICLRILGFTFTHMFIRGGEPAARGQNVALVNIQFAPYQYIHIPKLEYNVT